MEWNWKILLNSVEFLIQIFNDSFRQKLLTVSTLCSSFPEIFRENRDFSVYEKVFEKRNEMGREEYSTFFVANLIMKNDVNELRWSTLRMKKIILGRKRSNDFNRSSNWKRIVFFNSFLRNFSEDSNQSSLKRRK